MFSFRPMLDGERVSMDFFVQHRNEMEFDLMMCQSGGGADDEEAPAATGAEAPITLKVRDQTGEEMFFKVKKGTEMSKIFNAYAGRRGVAANTLRFMLDDKRLKDTDTPKMLEMEEDDQIDVYLEQLGGGDEDAPSGAEAPITLKVKDQGGEEMFFKVKKGTEMSKIFNAYAGRRGVAATALRFMFDGKRVKETDTPKMLEMEEDDQLEAYLEQLGGGADDETEDTKPSASDDAAITISVKGQDGEATQFKVKKSTKLQKVFDAYIQRKGVNPGSVRFLFDGQAVQGTSTPKMLEMNDEDQIDAVLPQVGGY